MTQAWQCLVHATVFNSPSTILNNFIIIQIVLSCQVKKKPSRHLLLPLDFFILIWYIFIGHIAFFVYRKALGLAEMILWNVYI